MAEVSVLIVMAVVVVMMATKLQTVACDGGGTSRRTGDWASDVLGLGGSGVVKVTNQTSGSNVLDETSEAVKQTISLATAIQSVSDNTVKIEPTQNPAFSTISPVFSKLSSEAFEDVITTTAIPSLLLNKCCKSHEHLDRHQSSCVVAQNASFLDQGEEESVAALRQRGSVWWLRGNALGALKRAREDAIVRYGRRPCSSEITAVVFKSGAVFHPNGSLEVLNILKFSGDPEKKQSFLLFPEEYCADKTYLGNPPKPYSVFLTCPCARRHCVRKCCDYPQTMIVHPEVAMKRMQDCSRLSAQHKWNVSLKVDAGGLEASDASYALLGGPFLEPCASERMNIFLDSRNDDAHFDLLFNGSLTTKAQKIGSPFLPQEYCVDRVMSPDGTESLWALVCAKKPAPKPMGIHATIFAVLYIVGMLALIATLLVYLLVPTLRRPVNAKALMCHVAALAAALLVLCVSNFVPQVDGFEPCAALAFSAQYFLQAAFCWLSVLCFDIARGFSSSWRPVDISAAGATRRFRYYSLFAWGAPAVILAITIAFTYARDLPSWILRPGIGKRGCWFNNALSQFVYFNGPVGFLLSANLSMFFFTLGRLRIAQRDSIHLKKENIQLKGGALRTRKDCLVLFVKLFCLMGVTWVLEVVAWAVHAGSGTMLAISAINMIRGVVIFVACCCKRETLNALRARWGKGGKGIRQKSNGRSYTTTTTVCYRA